MKYEQIKILENKRVQLRTNDGFYITTTLPKNINNNIISVIDKFGKTLILDVSTIVSVREVQ